MTRLLPSGLVASIPGLRESPAPGTRPSDAIDGAVVEIDGVSVHLGDVTAVDDVSLAAEPGQVVGLIGPNGAGKTTLLRTITAAIAPSSGTVRVNGTDVQSRSSRAVSRLVATVPQATNIGFDFRVREIVAMGRTPYQDRFGRGHRHDTSAVADAMTRTDVARFADRPISAVSGGERQRVLLARAIAQDTPVLLLDEPTASLDINHQVRTLELVRGLAAEGTAVIAAIHDLDLAARYCDELALLDDGRLVAHGPPAAVLTRQHLEEVFGIEAVVTTDPVTGSRRVTALPSDGTDGGSGGSA